MALILLTEELYDDAATLADFVANLAKDLHRPQHVHLLAELADITRRLNLACKQLCDWSDENRGAR
jgi:hypothetical protein